MPTLYNQLAAMSVIVADTGDIDAIEEFKPPRDATTNPSLIIDMSLIYCTDELSMLGSTEATDNHDNIYQSRTTGQDFVSNLG